MDGRRHVTADQAPAKPFEITVTCRWDEARSENVYEFDPPGAEGWIELPGISGMVPGDTLKCAVGVSEA